MLQGKTCLSGAQNPDDIGMIQLPYHAAQECVEVFLLPGLVPRLIIKTLAE